jgi:hypothetical protein
VLMRYKEHRGRCSIKGEGIVIPLFPQLVNVTIFCKKGSVNIYATNVNRKMLENYSGGLPI